MPQKWLLVTSAALFATPLCATPVQLTAKTLFDSCTSSAQSANYVAYAEYMNEFVHRARSETRGGNSQPICLPSNIKSDEIAAIFVRMARSHEDFLIGPPYRAVRTAIEISFRCQLSR